jgi:type I restriction enzyme M protein
VVARQIVSGFYDMEHDGFSLDDKRQPVAENDIPDILECWKNRSKPAFATNRTKRLAQLHAAIEPLKRRRLQFHAEINRLTFENAIAPADDETTLARLKADREKLAALDAEINPLQREFNQLSRQFWVTKAQVAADKRYDLSPSRYRQVEQDDEFYEQPRVTLERMRKLEATATGDIQALAEILAKS